jgi:hypothetical protein
MKNVLLLSSLLLLIVGAALPLLVRIGGADPTDVYARREHYITAGSKGDQWLHRGFFWVEDHRPLLIVSGLLGVALYFWL